MSDDVSWISHLWHPLLSKKEWLFSISLKDKIQLVIDEMKNDNGNVVGTRVELKVPFGYL